MANAQQQTSSDDPARDGSGVVLLLQVPRTNGQKALAAEQLFASLHGLLTIPQPGLLKAARRERLSFEIVALDQRIGFYVWVPQYLKKYVEAQVHAQYPTVHISEVEDYAAYGPDTPTYTTQLVTELKFAAHSALPIRTFQSFEADPLAAITATLAKLDEDEEAWVQLLIKPAPGNWHRQSERYVAGVKGGGPKTTGLMSALRKSPETPTKAAKLTSANTTRTGAAQQKAQKPAFETQLRIVYRGNTSAQQAKLQMQSIIASYKQFNSADLNGFEAKRVADDALLVAQYRSRQFNKGGFVCNIEEAATLYHLPHTNVETPYILWATSQTAAPPANLPVMTPQTADALSPIAATDFRGHNTMFGLPRADRGRHLYIIGQAGTGKSGMLELLTISDIYSPYGFAVIDPHGAYASDLLKRIPAERAADVVYFNPADTEHPMGLNPLEVHDPRLKTRTCSELVSVIKRSFGNSWSPRLEYILRYTILALLDFPDATMLDITRILTEKKFRKQVLKYVTDPVVQTFWTIEFTGWNERFMAEAIAPILSKVGALTANPLVRNIIGQPKSSFNVRQIMDERRILIVNLSRELVGEDNAALLGALLVTKVQMAAMSRADTAAENRTPFYLYVDEFQNFATDSFATTLSEARKYGLSLTAASQYIAQTMQGAKDAVFGNVGSIIAFRTSADDARTMLQYLGPEFDEHSLAHLHDRRFAIRMTIEGEKAPAFSAISLNLPPSGYDYSPQIIEHSRAQYAQSREVVEHHLIERYRSEGLASPQPQARPVAASARGGAVPAPAARPAATGGRMVRPAPPPLPSGTATAVLSQTALSEAGATPATLPAGETEAVPPSANSAAAPAAAAAPPPAKPKRRRKRKKKSPAAAGTIGGPTEAQVRRAIEEGVIHLK